MSKPYTEYTAIVTAQTTAGQGQSANGSVTTPEEGMFTNKKIERIKPSQLKHLLLDKFGVSKTTQ